MKKTKGENMGLFESIPVEQHGMSEWTLVLAIIATVIITLVVKYLVSMNIKTQADVDQHGIEIRDLRENSIEMYTTIKNIDQKINTMLHDTHEMNAVVVQYLIDNKQR